MKLLYNIGTHIRTLFSSFHFRDFGSFHLQDGTWSTIKHSFTIVRDFKDVCFHSYFSLMDDLRQKQAPDGKYYEIRCAVCFCC